MKNGADWSRKTLRVEYLLPLIIDRDKAISYRSFRTRWICVDLRLPAVFKVVQGDRWFFGGGTKTAETKCETDSDDRKRSFFHVDKF